MNPTAQIEMALIYVTEYSLLAEASYGLGARRGFVYRIPDSRVFAVEITDFLRRGALAAVAGIRGVANTQSWPEATAVRGRCVECEFANYCADVW